MANDPRNAGLPPTEANRNIRAFAAYLAAAVCGLILLGIIAWIIWGSLGAQTPGDNSDQLAVQTKPLNDATKAKPLSELSNIPNPETGSSGASDAQNNSPLAPWDVQNLNNLAPNPVDLPVPVSLDFSKPVSLSDVPIPALVNLDIGQNSLSASDSAAEASFNESIRLQNLRKYIVSMCVDRYGNVWVGTEGNGIQRFSPSAPQSQQWKEYRVADGLGDDCCYALACDQQGRVWAGHVNHGVSVFNGSKWQNYDVVGGVSRSDSLSGPLGERVFAIKVCPTDGDVWIATNAGLARYSERLKRWSYYTKADGMPSDLANAITFDQQGNIYLASQCDGIVMADAADDYRAWRSVSGPDELPRDPAGTGLPTGMMNDVLVAHNGTVYAATTTGLAWSIDQGKSWRYVRGTDWADKARGSIRGVPADWNPEPGALLAEDYVVCLGEDPQGFLYVGYRNNGWERLIETGDGSPALGGKGGSGYVSALPTILVKVHLAGSYGNGILPLEENSVGSSVNLSSAASAAPPLPVGATPPNSAELRGILGALENVPPLVTADSPTVFALEDDWRTQGDWLGRYGRYWAVIPAIDAYDDYIWGAGPEKLQYVTQIGKHHNPGDSLRRWIAQLYTDDVRIPEMPPVYMDSRLKHGFVFSPEANRRLGQWDDHGEGYPITYEGPDIYTTIGVPSGTFVLSVYQVNDNSQAVPDRDFKMVFKSRQGDNLSDLSGFDEQPELAIARVSNFSSGVYKRFLVRGPQMLTLKVCRNYSLNANISAFMLDLLDERPVPYFKSMQQWQDERTKRAQLLTTKQAAWNGGRRRVAQELASETTKEQLVTKILDGLDDSADWNPKWWTLHERALAILLARWCAANYSRDSQTHESLMVRGSCFYRAGLYGAWESCLTSQSVTTARQIEESLRWDGITPAYSGTGFETVTAYLASLQDGKK